MVHSLIQSPSAVSLGILIPTRNRAVFLAELLDCLMPQTLSTKVNVYVRDNCSTDNTNEVVKNSQKIYPNLFYKKNTINIGGDANFLMLVHECQDDYFWLFGDDELLRPLALEKVIEMLTERPAYLVFDGIDGSYSNASEYISSRFKLAGEFLLGSTLITANIVRRDIFDVDYASTKYSTHYGHMYAIFKGLAGHPAKIISTENKYFIVRSQRARPVDGDWPEGLEVEWHKYLKFLAGAAAINYPWFQLTFIRYKRRVRHLFGNIVTSLISASTKKWIKQNLLSRSGQPL